MSASDSICRHYFSSRRHEIACRTKMQPSFLQKHTTGGIPRWSPGSICLYLAERTEYTVDTRPTRGRLDSAQRGFSSNMTFDHVPGIRADDHPDHVLLLFE